MNDFNKDEVVDSLGGIVEFLEENKIEYRFLGSVVFAAINGKLHRNLGDLDLIIDIKGKELLFDYLIQKGYKRAYGLFSFARKFMALETMESPNLLGVGFFYGRWEKDGSYFLGNKNINVRIEGIALTPTKYTLYGIEFLGLPKRVIATGINSSKVNPKRQKELIILQEKNILPLPNNYIHVNILGIKADWIYFLFMSILNIMGRVRVKLGLSFDPWR